MFQSHLLFCQRLENCFIIYFYIFLYFILLDTKHYIVSHLFYQKQLTNITCPATSTNTFHAKIKQWQSRGIYNINYLLNCSVTVVSTCAITSLSPRKATKPIINVIIIYRRQYRRVNNEKIRKRHNPTTWPERENGITNYTCIQNVANTKNKALFI